MLQEKSLDLLDKYFLPKRITQIIGESSSLKESFISIYIAHKVMNTSSKVIFIWSKPTFNLNYIYEVHKKRDQNFSPEKFEEKYLIFEFIKFDSMGEFILKKLHILLEKEKNVSTIVLNNLNKFFSSKSYKSTHDNRIYSYQLLYYSRKYNLNIIYLNDFFYYCETKFLSNRNNINYKIEEKDNNKSNDIITEKDRNKEEEEEEEDNENEIESYYNKEPVNSDIMAEYCSHIIIAENKKQKAYLNNKGEIDYKEQGIFKVIKSNYKTYQRYLINIDKKDFSYNVEIN